MVLRVTRYVAIRAPVLTILLSLPNYYVTTYWVTLGYTTLSGLLLLPLFSFSEDQVVMKLVERSLAAWVVEYFLWVPPLVPSGWEV
jgi:hypothetical protein